MVVPETTGGELGPCPAGHAEDSEGEPEGPCEHEAPVDPDGDGDDGGAREFETAAGLEPLERGAVGAFAEEEHGGAAEEAGVEDHGDDADDWEDAEGEEGLGEIEAGAAGAEAGGGAAPCEPEEPCDETAAGDEGDLGEAGEEEDPLAAGEGREREPAEDGSEDDGGDEDGPEADGWADERAVDPEDPAVFGEDDALGDVGAFDGEGDAVCGDGGLQGCGGVPFEADELFAGADGDDDGVAVAADWDGLSVEGEGSDVGSGFEGDGKVAADAGFEVEDEGGGTALRADIGVVPAAADGGGFAGDWFRAGDGEVDGFAGPWVPRGDQVRGVGGKDWGEPVHGDVPERGGFEEPAFDPEPAFFCGEGEGGLDGEFAFPCEFLVGCAEADLDAAVGWGDALGEDSFTGEERELEGDGFAFAGEPEDAGAGLPDEAEFEVAFDGGDGVEVAAVVGGFGACGCLLAGEEDLGFGDAAGFETGDVPAGGGDFSETGFEEECPLPFGSGGEEPAEDELVDASGEGDPEEAVASGEGGGGFTVDGDGEGRPCGQLAGEGDGAVGGGVDGGLNGEGAVLEFEFDEGDFGCAGEGVGCFEELLAEVVEERGGGSWGGFRGWGELGAGEGGGEEEETGEEGDGGCGGGRGKGRGILGGNGSGAARAEEAPCEGEEEEDSDEREDALGEDGEEKKTDLLVWSDGAAPAEGDAAPVPLGDGWSGLDFGFAVVGHVGFGGGLLLGGALGCCGLVGAAGAETDGVVAEGGGGADGAVGGSAGEEGDGVDGFDLGVEHAGDLAAEEGDGDDGEGEGGDEGEGREDGGGAAFGDDETEGGDGDEDAP